MKKPSLSLLALPALLVAALGLSACDNRPATVVAVPVPSEPASVPVPVPGPPGPQGEPGKPGEGNTTVVVVPPAGPASAGTGN